MWLDTDLTDSQKEVILEQAQPAARRLPQRLRVPFLKLNSNSVEMRLEITHPRFIDWLQQLLVALDSIRPKEGRLA
jgi:hypothetical protein